MPKITYKDSGVDLDIYAESMARLPNLVRRTFSDRVIPLDGGFAGLFRLNSEKARYTDPVLVSCTDGVGTKLKVACQANRHDTVGIDLVAMSVNDAICCGAEPLFFLNYVAMPKDDPDLLEQIVAGIAEGCVQSGCALLGGETAIMSDMYKPGEYDLAGFCVGVAEREKIIDGKAIQPGDVLIGVESSGLHSNGYSLVRKIVFEIAGLKINDYVPELGQTVAEVLLTPTRIYVKPVLNLLKKFGANEGIRGIAHITGGGLDGNLGRILPLRMTTDMWQLAQLYPLLAPKGLSVDRAVGEGAKLEDWPTSKVFRWLQDIGKIEDDEMNRVFNKGIGLVLVVHPDCREEVRQTLSKEKLKSLPLGEIVKA